MIKQRLLLSTMASLLMIAFVFLLSRFLSGSVPENPRLYEYNEPEPDVFTVSADYSLPAGDAGPGEIAPEEKEPEIVYTPEELSAQGTLVKKTVKAFAAAGSITDEIRSDLESLSAQFPQVGARWSTLMEYWAYLNGGMRVLSGECSDGLPDDNSLCIVVMGYQLDPDGVMKPELVNRCETALACAEKYPNAYIAVTGGGTAWHNRNITEAGTMAQWFIEKGIAAERIIIENSSMTTGENAIYTTGILTEEYPEVNSLVIVTSDYHVRRGCLVFTAQALLNGMNIHVVSNAGFNTGRTESSPLRMQSSELLEVVEDYFKT